MKPTNDDTERNRNHDVSEVENPDEGLKRLHDEWGWQRLEGGELIANGAMMNDIESTELLRQFLTERLEEDTITPFVYTRRDRAGRTASFVHYPNRLHANSLIGRIHTAGTQDTLLQHRVNAEVVLHDESEPAASVLDSVLQEGRPVYLMGNTVAGFMRELSEEIDRRSID